MSAFEGKNILLVLTGSIACFKTAIVISELVKQGANVKTVTTASALNFIGEATLEGLTGNKNQSDIFESGQMMQHIFLARWADAILVYPASANYIGQMANGLATNLAANIYLAKEPMLPFLLAPAMNQAMWNHAAVKRNMRQLQSDAVIVLNPEPGVLACGEEGDGRLMSPDRAIEALKNCLAPRGGSVLITYGGTVEAIDSVRAITNFSTGKTGKILSEQLAKKGWRVKALHSKTSAAPEGSIASHCFSDFESLNTLLKAHLEEEAFDAVIHLAAVSDFSVEQVVSQSGDLVHRGEKISSDANLTIHLKPNFKILNRLKTYGKNRSVQVIGFKLTVGADEPAAKDAVAKVFAQGGVDFVVQNDLKSVSVHHEYKVFNDTQSIVDSGIGKAQMADSIHRLLKPMGESVAESCFKRENEVQL